MILKLLLNACMIWMIFIKLLKNIIKKKKTLQNYDYFDDMIADMLSNKKLNPTLTELLIKSGKPNISLVFITKSYSAVPKNIRLDSTH